MADDPRALSPADAETHGEITPTRYQPLAVVTEIDGTSSLDTTERLRLGDGSGGTLRPGNPVGSIAPATRGAELYAGDRIETGAGTATLRLNGGGDLVLAAHSRIVIPPFGGSDAIVSRGIVTLRAGRADASVLELVVDAPGARLTATNGTARIAVSEDARTLVANDDATVTAFSVPASQSTAILGAPTARSGGHSRGARHPVSLDVAVNELETALARPIVALPLPAGSSQAFQRDGSLDPESAGPSGEAAVLAWRARNDHPVARPGGHTLPIIIVSRAGAADLADARTLIATLRGDLRNALGSLSAGNGGAAEAIRQLDETSDTRMTIENQLGAALGRAVARADRGRTLATRGGDVTALVALARTEAVIVLARELLPPRALRMLDSRERRRVP